MRLFISALLMAGGLTSSSTLLAASDFDDKNLKLQKLRQLIGQQEKRLQQKNRIKDQEYQQIKELELSIHRQLVSIRQLEEKSLTLNDKATRLKQEKTVLLDHLAMQREQLSEELRLFYILQRQPTFKLLLNQKNPARLKRVNTYINYLSEARTRKMHDMQEKLQEIAQIDASLQATLQEVSSTYSRKKTALQKLDARMAERKKALVLLEQRLKVENRELSRLYKDSKGLGLLLENLRQALADIPAETHKKTFHELKGQLKWPVSGRIFRAFGTKVRNTVQISRGVLIATDTGQEVTAISHGRVAFTSWLRGFGLLMIVDHGNGFMSLYGQNQALYKEVGEWVDMGDVIAISGNSGAQARNGLYFELRHNGEPVDPMLWCAGKPG
ncbi:MAG: peptidoglycan DD-metalloendopeptidase family protein [Gammaproteobacteria bacterium]